MSSLAGPDRTRLLNCSADERKTILDGLDPDKRRLVLASIPPNALEGLPDAFVQEANNARRLESEERNKEMRRQNPPLREILTEEQLSVAKSGTEAERLALLNSSISNKRLQVLRMMPIQTLAAMPKLRREAMALSQPQQFVNAELIENKLYRAIYSNRQLEEVLVDFWMNHFNVFNGKGPDRMLLTSYERDAIRPHVFGHFKRHAARDGAPSGDAVLPGQLAIAGLRATTCPVAARPAARAARAQRELRPRADGAAHARRRRRLHAGGCHRRRARVHRLDDLRPATGTPSFSSTRRARSQGEDRPRPHDSRRGRRTGRLEVIDILAHHPSTAQIHLEEAGAAIRRRRSAAGARRPHGGDIHARPTAICARSSRRMFTSRGVPVRRRVAGEAEVAARDGGQRRARCRARTSPTRSRWRSASPISVSRCTAKLEPTGYPNTGEAWANTAGIPRPHQFRDGARGRSDSRRQDRSEPFQLQARVGRGRASCSDGAPSPATLAAIEKGVAGHRRRHRRCCRRSSSVRRIFRGGSAC